VQADIDSLHLDPQGLKEFAAKLRVEGGRLALDSVETPVEDVTLDAVAASDQIQIRSFNADYAGGRIAATGTISNFSAVNAVPLTAVQVNLSNFSLARALPPARDGQPSMEGILSAAFQGTVRGKSSPAILQSLSGQGQVQIQDPVVRNLNVLREVFGKLSMFPGLLNNLQQRLPESYNERLNARDTVLAPIDLPFSAQNGLIAFDRLNLSTDTFQVTGRGSFNTLGQFRSQAVLRIEPELSKALIETRPEFQTISNPQGELEMPLLLQDAPPYVIPDYQFLASRFAASKTQEFLSNILQEKTGTGQTVPGQTTGPGTPQTNPDGTAQQQPGPAKIPKTRDLLGQLLQTALQPPPSQTSGSQQSQDSDTY
jgi:hypothetical protein